MNLQEQLSRKKSMMGLLFESIEDKQIVLLDGTSSAGKSHTLNHLNAVSYYNYELNLNESKRNIKLLNKAYVDQFESDFQKVMS